MSTDTPTRPSLLAPRSLAIVGASERSTWCAMLLANLEKSGFDGTLHLVNPRRDQLFGRPAIPDLAAAGGPVDCCFLAVGTTEVLGAVRAAGDAGAGTCIVLASGFAEAGPEGVSRQSELIDLARQRGIRVLGPNSIGFFAVSKRVGLLAAALEQAPRSGGLALVTQSGGLSHGLCNIARARDVGIHSVVTTGNEAMLDVTSVIEELLEDPEVRAIGAFVEAIRRPRPFIDAAVRALDRGVPVVVLKAGRTELGARLASTHSGAMADDDRIVTGAFHQYGVIEVGSLEELVATGGFMADDTPPAGGRIFFVTASGGKANLLADRAQLDGLELPPVPPAVAEKVRARLSDISTVENPLDIGLRLVAEPDVFPEIAELVANETDVDAFVVAVDLPVAGSHAGDLVAGLFTRLAKLADQVKSRIYFMGTSFIDITQAQREMCRAAGIPHVLSGTALGTTALGKAAWWASRRAARLGSEPPGASARVELAAGGGPLAEPEVLALLLQVGVQAPPFEVADNDDGAVEAAARVGWPVAVKVVSRHLLHKTDVGGVVLGAATAADVRAAVRAIRSSVADAAPDTPIEGVMVSAMRPEGIDLIVGVFRHDRWGPVLTLGAGGVLAELLGEPAIRLLPVGAEEVRSALRAGRLGRLLGGYRSVPAADMDAVVGTIMGVVELALAFGERLVHLEVNPMRVSGARVEALDAVLHVTE